MLSALDKLIAENARLCYCDTVPTTAAASYFDVERGEMADRSESDVSRRPASRIRHYLAQFTSEHCHVYIIISSLIMPICCQ